MNRFLRTLAVILVMGLALLGCGATAAPTAVPSFAKQAAPMAPAPTMAAAPASSGARSSAGESTTDTKASTDTTAADQQKLIIRTGTMVLIVNDVPVTVDSITGIANDSGGLVLRTDTRHQGDLLISTVSIKVPVESFDDVTAKLRKLAVKVDSDSASSQDVTEEFVDLDARVKVMEATEQQLLTFLQRTQNVDESLKVYRELTNVRSQIESIKGRMNYLQKSAAMSTITVTVRPVEKDKPIVQEEGWDPLRVVRNALRSLVNALQGLLNALIYVLVLVVPILIVIAIPLSIVRALWRRMRRKTSK
jgi:hypothetical protein